jgi:hypothetical protein
LALHVHRAPETPDETLSHKDFKGFFNSRDSEILDLIERANRIAAAG